MTSVRRTLIATLLAATTAVTAFAGALVFRLTRSEVDQVFDYHLRQIALSLRDQALGRPPAVVRRPSPEFEFVVQIWDVDGVKLYTSGDDVDLPEVARIGFATVQTRSGAWRVYSADLAGQLIQVAQPLRVREQLALSAALRTMAPLMFALPLLGFLVWWIVGRALSPLRHLASAVAATRPAALAPIAEADAPEEVLPLVHALNELLQRLGATLAAQRAFVADAAHELRTPLAALQLQLQLAERARDDEERSAAMRDLQAGLGRASHAVQQLLTLAREEPEVQRGPAATAPVALSELVGEVIADESVVAEAKGVDLGAARRDEAAVVDGDAAALRTLLANLVDNAVRYTPAGGRVDVSAVAGERPTLEVADTGPGIPASERERVFDRFYRRSADGTGAGLGLAIVKVIAERHRATVDLGDTPGGGLTVRVSFAQRTPPP